MHTEQFARDFNRYFPPKDLERVSTHFEDACTRSFFDPCFDVEGMTSIKKQLLLKLAVSCLEPGECYYEVGSYQGKSLVSALHAAPGVAAYACDNFAEFQDTNSLERLETSLEKYGLRERVTIFNSDFRRVTDREHIRHPVGVYFYDGAHDYQSQFDGIQLAEPLLAPRALVIVDDWRLAADSQSYARMGTHDAIRQSPRAWTQLYELPARYNGDQGMWWNGVGVFSTRVRL
jgi:predicted O-methyltransferase YrrM